jgi:dGTPase
MSCVYDEASRERLVPEPDQRPGRTAFQRDRARVLHSGALRRLAGKTQVVEPVGSHPLVPRTRLTHSLECAQIGRELGGALGADPDVVVAACLAHDLGHPPFGHNGEQALDDAATRCGGFEGNAQSFRLLTRLEPKVDGAGLNLTRATLDAATKYPWAKDERTKFGVYDDDLATFQWLRAGASGEQRPLETQVMDFSDDVAYSVHDLEDGVVAGLIDLELLRRPDERSRVAERAASTYSSAAQADLEAAFAALLDEPWWPRHHLGTHADHAALKSAGSTLIGRFCTAAERATRERYGDQPLTRYAGQLVVPDTIRLEVAALKAVAAVYVMDQPEARARQAREREVLADVVERLLDRPHAMEPSYRELWDKAPDEAAALRVVVDQVAALTDAAAWGLHTQLVGGST